MKSNTLGYLHYLIVFFIGVSLLLSLFIFLYSLQHNKSINNFNTWQFPMLLALFFDGLLVLHNKTY